MCVEDRGPSPLVWSLPASSLQSASGRGGAGPRGARRTWAPGAPAPRASGSALGPTPAMLAPGARGAAGFQLASGRKPGPPLPPRTSRAHSPAELPAPPGELAGSGLGVCPLLPSRAPLPVHFQERIATEPTPRRAQGKSFIFSRPHFFCLSKERVGLSPSAFGPCVSGIQRMSRNN